jgi:hypothetical protein
MSRERERESIADETKGEVACCAPGSGADIALHLRISSLQVTSGFACSVASLSLFPNHYLPGQHNFRCTVPADRQFD